MTNNSFLILYYSSNSLLLKIQINLSLQNDSILMFRAALFITASSQKEPIAHHLDNKLCSNKQMKLLNGQIVNNYRTDDNVVLIKRKELLKKIRWLRFKRIMLK